MKSLLHVVEAATRGACVHVDIERLMIKTALVDWLVVIHWHFKITIQSFVDAQSVWVLIVLQAVESRSGALVLRHDEQNHGDEDDDDDGEHRDHDTNDMLFGLLIEGSRWNNCENGERNELRDCWWALTGLLLIRPHQLISMREESVPENSPLKRGEIHKSFTHHKTENLHSARKKGQKCFTTSRIINFLDGISLAGIQHVILLTIFGLWNPSKCHRWSGDR